MKRFLLLATIVATPFGAGPMRAAESPRPVPAPQRLARLEASSPHPVSSSASANDMSNPCLVMLSTDPAGASDYARNWSSQGGGDAATQCAALSAVALGDPDAGAASLDSLASQPQIAPERRGVLADEASQAWLVAARPDRALASAATAVALDPASPALRTDHARAALAAGHPDQAVTDLSQVLAQHPGDTEALVVRAAAYRKLNRIDAARSDIDAVCAALPDEPEALLERGILRERLGDIDGARSDWSRILSVSPDTHEADLAQQDLALLDAGPEAR